MTSQPSRMFFPQDKIFSKKGTNEVGKLKQIVSKDKSFGHVSPTISRNHLLQDIMNVNKYKIRKMNASSSMTTSSGQNVAEDVENNQELSNSQIESNRAFKSFTNDSGIKKTPTSRENQPITKQGNTKPVLSQHVSSQLKTKFIDNSQWSQSQSKLSANNIGLKSSQTKSQYANSQNGQNARFVTTASSGLQNQGNYRSTTADVERSMVPPSEGTGDQKSIERAVQEFKYTIEASFNKINEKLENFQGQMGNLQQEMQLNNKLINRLVKRQKTTAAAQPPCLPFKTIEDLLKFNDVNDETYAEVVNYLAYLGGINATDSVARHLKCAFEINKILLSRIT